MLNKLGRNDLCWCGSQIKYKKCHAEFEDKIEFYKLQGHTVPPRNIIKMPEQIAGIRESGKINIAVLDYIAESIRAGLTTEDINQLVYQKTIELGGVPAQLGYNGFPKSVCTSVNEQVCHGYPRKMWYYMTGILSMWTFQRSTRDTSRIPQECSLLGI